MTDLAFLAIVALLIAAAVTWKLGLFKRAPWHKHGGWRIHNDARGYKVLRRSADKIVIQLPPKGGKLGYVGKYIPLKDKRELVIEAEIEGEAFAIPEMGEAPMPATITPLFQRRGDNWSGEGKFDGYRWYAGFASRFLRDAPLTIAAPLEAQARWGGVQTFYSDEQPEAFAAALADTALAGAGFGGSATSTTHGIFGHGVLVLRVRAR